jgi:phytoene dehydrogenase-like protein
VAKEDFRRCFDADDERREVWRSLVEEPLGRAVERYLHDDLLRGLVFTDAKVGLFTHASDETLLQNRCFLYHVIGNKTGEWKVPVGGMGSVVRELEKAARKSGAEILTRVDLQSLDVNKKKRGAEFELDGKRHAIEARFLLVNFGRNVLARFIGKPYQPDPTDEGSVFKINMLLRRLPKLKTNHHPEAEAFCGTFRINEGYEEMNLSYQQALQGRLPDKLPSEIYCHTLTDDSILSPDLRAQGFHTMTLFGLDTPWHLFAQNNETMRQRAEQQFVKELNGWLAEPLEDCLAIARDGSLCIESKSPVDIEEALGLYHGNIFQKALTFPFAETREQVGTWGVETELENVFLCGASAHRGGAVSGIPGHNAAMKVLETKGGL